MLYIFAAGVVKGFAFALGLSTLIDLAVFFWFTHPMVTYLARYRFFNTGHRLSGLSDETLGIDGPARGARRRGREGLMGKFSRLGNALYEGRRLDRLRRSQVALVLHLRGDLGDLDRGALLPGPRHGHRVHRRRGVPRQRWSPRRSPRTPPTSCGRRSAGTGIDGAAAPVVTTSGNEAILIQTEPLTADESATVVDTILETTGATPDDISQSEIGASWGREIAERSLIGLAVFLVLVVLLIWAYFREWKMSVAAIVALAHDVLITVGIYALSGFEVTPATVTGILTILGFSLYDTVVVFDKVRENTKNLRRTRMTYAEAANLAVNQTLVRSINTSIVALIPVAAILYVGVVQLGSGSLKDLALALFVGMAAGAYSSIFIATPFLVQLKSREKGTKEIERRALAKRRHDADRYANVPSYTEDQPVRSVDDDLDDDRRGAAEPTGRRRRHPPSGARRGRGGRSRSGGAEGARAGRAERVVGAGAADPAEPLQARQEVSARAAAAAALQRHVIDVPDFPEPGVVFKDMTPLLADAAGFACRDRGPRRSRP